MTFTLDGYEPIALHNYPELMRAAAARTQVLRPAQPAATLTIPTAHVAAADDMPTVPAEPVVAPSAPPQPVEAYLVGMDAIAVLQQQLADFLDAAGPRRDVWVSVGVGSGSSVDWVLRSAVPYGVHALPRYPDTEPIADPAAAVAAAASAVAADATEQPDRRRLLVLVWDRPPAPVRLPRELASALVLHCVDGELDRVPADGWGYSLLLSRTRHRPRRSLLAQAGQLFTSWEAFRELPEGLVLTRLN